MNAGVILGNMKINGPRSQRMRELLERIVFSVPYPANRILPAELRPRVSYTPIGKSSVWAMSAWNPRRSG